MNDFKEFYFMGKKLRIKVKDSVIWFALVDILNILNLTKNPSELKKRLDTDEVMKEGLSLQKEVNFINEKGLYHLLEIFESKESKRLIYFVKSEIVMKYKSLKDFYENAENTISIASEIIKEQDERIKVLEKELCTYDYLHFATETKKFKECIEKLGFKNFDNFIRFLENVSTAYENTKS